MFLPSALLPSSVVFREVVNHSAVCFGVENLSNWFQEQGLVGVGVVLEAHGPWVSPASGFPKGPQAVHLFLIQVCAK
jgi:hypothetical protein